MVKELAQERSVAGHFIAELRDANVQQDAMRFRRNLERIGEALAMELSRTLDYEEREVTTPLGVARAHLLAEQPVLATILRAGLPLHQGLLNYFDRADNAFVSAYRKHRKGEDAFDIVRSKADQLILVQKTAIAVFTAVYFPALAGGSIDDRKYNCIQPGRVAAACGYDQFIAHNGSQKKKVALPLGEGE